MSDGNEFAELLWENGQAVVHGRRKHPQPSFQPFGTGSSGIQEKHPGGAGDNMMAFTKAAGVFGGMGMAPSLHDFAPGLQHENGDDDAVPWIHYPIMEDDDDDNNNNNNAPALTTADYSSDFFSELQEAAANLGSLPPSNQCTTNNRGTPVAGSSRAASKEIQGLPALTTRTAEPQAELAAAAAKQARPSDSVMNFSLFSRPAALARATLQSAHRPQGTDKVPNAGANNRMESTVIQAASGPRTGPVFADQRAAWPQQKEVRFTPAPAQTASVGNLQQEMARDKLSNNRVVQHKDAARKAPDATVTTSSVCSGNGVVNDEPWHQQKRKIQAECSASQDEDLDDESGALLTSTNRSMKRSRTAEVHNLSERRRRDKINEKMRALQELIPNCNKIDKASMLDEAIEYLKTLQLQVQMMSMGTGLCIPPMLLPPAMQHLQLSQMAHFPRLSMGLGYGMGVFDMNNTGTIPVSPMPGAHFPYQMIPGAAAQGLGIPGANAMQMFGIPGQAIPSSGSSVPPFTSLAGLLVRQNLAPEVSGAMPSMVQEQQQGTANQQQQSLNKEAKQ